MKEPVSLFDSDEFNRRLFFPRPDASPLPEGARDLFVDVGDARLHVRLHAGPAATLLLFHGNGEVVADYDGAAREFARAGASLAVVDYRGYGQSSGVPSLRSIIEDATHVLAQVTTTPLIVMGRSLGSACANELYGQCPERVAGFILESGFTDVDALVERRGMRRTREPAGNFDPLPKLERGTHPLLVLHGTNDTIIAPREAKAAYESAATRDKEIVMIEGRGHNDISFSPDYWSAMSRFLARVA